MPYLDAQTIHDLAQQGLTAHSAYSARMMLELIARKAQEALDRDVEEMVGQYDALGQYRPEEPRD